MTFDPSQNTLGGAGTVPSIGTGMQGGAVQELRELYSEHALLRDQWRPVWLDVAIHFAPPFATSMGLSLQQAINASYAGYSRQAASEYTSRVKTGLAPFFQQWLRLRAGWQMPKQQRARINAALREPSEALYTILENTGFADELERSLMYLGMGTAVMMVEADPYTELRFTNEPLAQSVVVEGANGQLEAFFRERMRTGKDILERYPDAELDSETRQRIKDHPLKRLLVIEGCRQKNKPGGVEGWTLFSYLAGASWQTLFELEVQGPGSCPWVWARWFPADNVSYGYGPMISALPDAKVLSSITEENLTAYSIANFGMWQYDAMSIINPETVQLSPGALIPRMSGTRIEPLVSGARPDWGALKMEDVRGQVARALYLDRLGSENGPVKSATEIIERQAELARVVGAPYGRLVGFLRRIARRVVHLTSRRGTLRLPPLDGKVMDIENLGPFARAQRIDQVMAADSFLGMLQMRFGPESVMAILNMPEFAHWLADMMDVDPMLLNSPQQIRQIGEFAANAVATGAVEPSTSAGPQ